MNPLLSGSPRSKKLPGASIRGTLFGRAYSTIGFKYSRKTYLPSFKCKRRSLRKFRKQRQILFFEIISLIYTHTNLEFILRLKIHSF